jgi:mannose/fructose/sorbose-specific phosphotransferase system IIA component
MQNTYGGIEKMNILLISHGLMAEGIVDSLKMLIGEVKGLDVITFGKEMGADELREVIEEYLENHMDNLLVFTDMKGGTPFNVVSVLTYEKENVEVFYGMNLPIIIEAVSMKEAIPLNELVEHIEENIVDSIGFSEL